MLPMLRARRDIDVGSLHGLTAIRVGLKEASWQGSAAVPFATRVSSGLPLRFPGRSRCGVTAGVGMVKAVHWG